MSKANESADMELVEDKHGTPLPPWACVLVLGLVLLSAYGLFRLYLTFATNGRY